MPTADLSRLVADLRAARLDFEAALRDSTTPSLAPLRAALAELDRSITPTPTN
jgi:hypothetical protein